MKILFLLLLTLPSWAQERVSDDEFRKMWAERAKIEAQRSEERRTRLMATLKATNQPDTVKDLRLAKMNLKKIPRVVYRFKNLKNIDLSNNQITRFPRRLTRKLDSLHTLTASFNPIKKLKFSNNQHVKVLNMSSCGIRVWPITITQNTALETLILAVNEVVGIPDDIQKLSRLRVLSFYKNKITSVSPSIENLTELREIDLYHNQLREIPLPLCHLKNLRTLAMSYNSITSLPEAIGELKNLSALYLRDNGLQQLPPQIASLENLKELYLEANRFEQFPAQLLNMKQLEEIDLSKNKIKALPLELNLLKKLKEFDIRQNPLQVSKENTLIIRQLQKDGVQVYGFEVIE